MMPVVFMVLALVCAQSGYGQHAPGASGTGSAASAQPGKLTGFFQLPNKVAFLEIESRNGTLVAKELWANKEYQLVHLEGMRFETKQEGYPLEFIKDASGSVSAVKMLGRIMATRVDFDPGKTINLSTMQLERLEGTYLLQNDDKYQLTIRTRGNGLLLKQLWDNKEIAFTPRSELFFLNGDGTFPLSFASNGSQIARVTCFESDLWISNDLSDHPEEASVSVRTHLQPWRLPHIRSPCAAGSG